MLAVCISVLTVTQGKPTSFRSVLGLSSLSSATFPVLGQARETISGNPMDGNNIAICLAGRSCTGRINDCVCACSTKPAGYHPAVLDPRDSPLAGLTMSITV
jgi:hypothetical protein